MKRPFVYLAVSLAAGIYLASVSGVPLHHAFLLTVLFISAAVAFSRNRLVSCLLIYISMASFGFVLYEVADIIPQDHMANFATEEEKSVYLKGAIVDDPVIGTTFYKKDKATFLLASEYIMEDGVWYKTSGMARVDLYGADRPFGYGDEVVLEGILSRPDSLKNPGLFDYSKYLAMRDVRAVLKVKESFLAEPLGASSNPVKKAAFGVKHRMRALLKKYLKDPYGGFLEAILLGDRAGLKDSLEEDFIKTGTVHVISISGLHVGLIAGMLMALFVVLRLPKRANLIVTLVVLVFYAVLAGACPPIIRSVMMFAVFAIGYIMRRDTDILNSLALAAFLILIALPKQLFDPSFQLSFVSLGATIILTPRIERLLGLPSGPGVKNVSRAKLYLIRGVSVSLAAWLGSWPLVASYFNIVSPVSIIANLLIVPALAVLTAASFVFIFVGGAFRFAAPYLAQVLCLIESAIFAVNHILADMPLAYIRMPAPGMTVSILYYAFAALVFAPVKKKYLLTASLVALNFVVWREAASSFKKENTGIIFFDVGQGDSALVTLPGDIHILVDAGSGGEEKFDIGRNVIAPYLWNAGIGKLDLVIVTHAHEDHLGGMPYILKDFKVGAVADNGAGEQSGLFRGYKKILTEKRIRHIPVKEGDLLRIGQAVISVFNPGQNGGAASSNDNSVAFRIDAPGVSAFFCGDITGNVMERLLLDGADVGSDILKVPHHGGSLGGSRAPELFFEKISPRISIISARKKSAGKRFIDVPGSDIYITGRDGAVEVSAFMGGDLRVKGSREK